MKIDEKKVLKALSNVFKNKRVKILRIDHYRYTEKECDLTVHIDEKKDAEA